MIGQSFQAAQTIDADTMSDPRFLEESWTLGVSAALKNRQQRLQRQAAQQVAQQKTSSMYDGLGGDFFVRLRQWDQQQAAPIADAPCDTEATQSDANHDWDRFNAARQSHRRFSAPTEMNADLAHRLLGVTAISSREQIRSAG